MNAFAKTTKAFDDIAECDDGAHSESMVKQWAQRLTAAAQEERPTREFWETPNPARTKAVGVLLQLVFDRKVAFVEPVFRAIFEADQNGHFQCPMVKKSAVCTYNAVGLATRLYTDEDQWDYLDLLASCYPPGMRSRMVEKAIDLNIQTDPENVVMWQWMTIAERVAMPSDKHLERLMSSVHRQTLADALCSDPFNAVSANFLRCSPLSMNERYGFLSVNQGLLQGHLVHAAVWNKNKGLLAHLLDEGADPLAPCAISKGGDTQDFSGALALAHHLRHEECATVLIAHGAKSHVNGLLASLNAQPTPG